MSAQPLAQTVADESFRLREWRVDPALNQISRDQETVRLEPRTMRLLVRLAETPGQVVSSRELLDTVWAGVVVGPASVYQAISQLRKLLGDTDPIPTFIATIPRKGYRLVAPVRRTANVAADPPAIMLSSPTISNPSKRPRAYLLWGITALLIVTLGLVASLAIRNPQRTRTAGIPAPDLTLNNRAIAIAPFEPATQDEATQMLAPIVTDLLRTRLAALQNLVVVANGSIMNALRTEQDLGAVARQVHARYLLRGEVRRARDQVRMNVTLVDVETGSPVWSMPFDRPVEQIATINEEIAKQTAQSLQIALEPASSASAYVPADLSTYELYLRGQELMSTFRAGDADQATVIFSRVTTLDPVFARGYYALGEALLLAADLGARQMTEELAKQAGRAFDRAIELNPALGPAWAQRARLTSDPVQAEELYRRALQLAPSYDESYIRYSDFLFSQGRRGEALALIDRALRLDPLSSALYWRKAQLLLATRGDMAGMEQLLNKALAITPDFPTALRDLAKSKYMWHGEFAEAIRLMERVMTVDPESHASVGLAVELYLAIGDLPAAMALLRDMRQPVKLGQQQLLVSIYLYQRDIKRAADVARSVMREWLTPPSSTKAITDDLRVHAVHNEMASGYWATANAIRDEAIVTGDFAPALDLIERTTLLFSGTSPMRNRGLVLTYAHILLLAGETRRGRELLTSLLEHLDAEQIGRPAHMFAWERAAAFAMLGEDERALTELAASQKTGRFAGWRYTAELDPIYLHLRHDPRFQALAARAQARSQQQRALLDEMRRNGEVPKRS
jgi:DNA-binding winged helix-turn-helix (wHTH) protein/TolB-like protein/Tfp pilus assembly protein PilF